MKRKDPSTENVAEQVVKKQKAKDGKPKVPKEKKVSKSEQKKEKVLEAYHSAKRKRETAPDNTTSLEADAPLQTSPAKAASEEQELALLGFVDSLTGEEQKVKQIGNLMKTRRAIDDQNVAPVDSLLSCIDSAILENVKDLGVQTLFPVQNEVIPQIVNSCREQFPSDFCVCAPTGSGKTLCYVVPIIQFLSNRTVRRLRALVLLPTRHLVLQVLNVFESVAKGTNLKIEAIHGQTSFKMEQEKLIDSAKNKFALSNFIQTHIPL